MGSQADAWIPQAGSALISVNQRLKKTVRVTGSLSQKRPPELCFLSFLLFTPSPVEQEAAEEAEVRKGRRAWVRKGTGSLLRGPRSELGRLERWAKEWRQRNAEQPSNQQPLVPFLCPNPEVNHGDTGSTEPEGRGCVLRISVAAPLSLLAPVLLFGRQKRRRRLTVYPSQTR